MKRKNGLASSKPSTSNLSAPSSPVAATPSPFATTARSPLHCFLQPSFFCFYSIALDSLLLISTTCTAAAAIIMIDFVFVGWLLVVYVGVEPERDTRAPTRD